MSDKQKKIRIIAIIDKKTVIINAGSDDGVNKKQEFNIIDNNPVIIKDPDTGEILDKFSRYKQKLYVKEVRQKYSICVSKYKASFVGASLASMVINSESFIQPSDSLEQKTVGSNLNVDDSEISNILSEYSYAKVHINDEVVLTTNK
ncbi:MULTISPECIES: hypothetical protein [Lactiplantibacillus]|uniref:Uncharacterized protein n=1 Tax=Lactiplantibacillus pentosus TaxID=1589 RepID=A0AB37RCG5_LACPE|nr:MULTISPECIES: hypothetical protein [Lactiplantibacillus]MDG2545205.1 hypothetical protein [Lactiplantibacillus plantarum]PRO82611.1 hypothetical protein C6Y10_12415 [Lactiplantibacillus pentosus]RMW41266.1 hypothetical protein D6U19_16755 [Lactiplantibacillus pentosus]RMW45096.1 hypothetical protein D6U20_09195 [Lactiplantibacillus pentosus]RMW51267.1 hypothetical protein D6U17_16460 [Lactiplantibacillus pentosus]